MSATAMVAVEDLRVGMFVHLDVGWMSHPFPLSSFKISSMEQIEVIRGLGMKQLRWSPERSDPEPGAGEPTDEASSQPATPTERPVDPAEAARRAEAAWIEHQQAALRSASASTWKPAAICARSPTAWAPSRSRPARRPSSSRAPCWTRCWWRATCACACWASR
jgi:hypothetical protein